MAAIGSLDEARRKPEPCGPASRSRSGLDKLSMYRGDVLVDRPGDRLATLGNLVQEGAADKAAIQLVRVQPC